MFHYLYTYLYVIWLLFGNGMTIPILLSNTKSMLSDDTFYNWKSPFYMCCFDEKIIN